MWDSRTVGGAGQNQPYWIDFSVPRGPRNTPPGNYTGNISIVATQGSVTIPVTLTVWNFELPAQPSELSVWSLWPPAAGNSVTTLARALMRNKVMTSTEVVANASANVANFGLNRFGLNGLYFVGIKCDGSYSTIPRTSQINAAVANFRPDLPLDIYVADELNACPNAHAALKTVGTNVHAAIRTVKTTMTINTPLVFWLTNSSSNRRASFSLPTTTEYWTVTFGVSGCAAR